MQGQLTQAEQLAVQKHRQLLAARTGAEVTEQQAMEDWLANCAVRWREDRQARYLAKQREEMLRYKWIESEKAHRDLGRDAIMDWIQHYAAQWRAWYEQEYADEEA